MNFVNVYTLLLTILLLVISIAIIIFIVHKKKTKTKINFDQFVKCIIYEVHTKNISLAYNSINCNTRTKKSLSGAICQYLNIKYNKKNVFMIRSYYQTHYNEIKKLISTNEQEFSENSDKLMSTNIINEKNVLNTSDTEELALDLSSEKPTSQFCQINSNICLHLATMSQSLSDIANNFKSFKDNYEMRDTQVNNVNNINPITNSILSKDNDTAFNDFGNEDNNEIKKTSKSGREKETISLDSNTKIYNNDKFEPNIKYDVNETFQKCIIPQSRNTEITMQRENISEPFFLQFPFTM